MGITPFQPYTRAIKVYQKAIRKSNHKKGILMMAKKNSPAFNFYSSDFLTETTFFTNEQTGAYIKLLCYQHQFDYLTKEQILSVTKDEIVLSKFCEKNGKFYNKNLKEIIDKKKTHCKKQRENALKRWGKNEDATVMPSHKNGSALAMPLEIEKGK